MSDFLQVSTEVAEALERGRPVVALETSIVGQGLPAPHNLQAALGCVAVIRDEGAMPATIGVLDGCVRVGLTRADIERIAAGSEKVSSRDLGPALVHQKAGATTVAATMRAAWMAGIRSRRELPMRSMPRACWLPHGPPGRAGSWSQCLRRRSSRAPTTSSRRRSRAPVMSRARA